jgi:hypothetical protein
MLTVIPSLYAAIFVQFNEHGHSARTVFRDEEGGPVLSRVLSRSGTRVLANTQTQGGGGGGSVDVKKKDGEPEVRGEKPSLAAQAELETKEKHSWRETTKHGFTAAWKFVSSPTGFFMTLYGLNVIAWGAMLFFLLLGAAPAMNHPSKNNINSPRKKWIEIDSQILNALFCVTGFGLAPWRFRDLWWLIKVRVRRDRHAMGRLSEQNKRWFRPPSWFEDEEGEGEKRVTFTGHVAPSTRLWKLSLVVWMMVFNTLFQAGLAGMMWGYNRINRPTWSAGTFIGLGCGMSLLAGLMIWWEGRKMKRIEGPAVKVVEKIGD